MYCYVYIFKTTEPLKNNTIKSFTETKTQEHLKPYFYANSHTGVCLGIEIPEGRAMKVVYEAKRLQNEIELSPLEAAIDPKLIQKVVGTKFKEWETDGMSLLDVPISCMTSIIAGPRSSPELQEKLRAKAIQIGCHFFQLKIGRSSATPYFISNDGKCYVFDGGTLKLTDNICCNCNEPTNLDIKECSWCQITDSHRLAAARKNPYRMLRHYGLLDTYIEGVMAIDREVARKRRESL